MRQPEPWRFCLWGHRRGYIQVGSIEDARYQAEQEYIRRMIRQMTRSMERLTTSFEHLRRQCVPCADAAARLGESLRRIAPRRHGSVRELRELMRSGALRL